MRKTLKGLLVVAMVAIVIIAALAIVLSGGDRSTEAERLILRAEDIIEGGWYQNAFESHSSLQYQNESCEAYSALGNLSGSNMWIDVSLSVFNSTSDCTAAFDGWGTGWGNMTELQIGEKCYLFETLDDRCLVIMRNDSVMASIWVRSNVSVTTGMSDVGAYLAELQWQKIKLLTK
jgi:hypothetical protein